MTAEFTYKPISESKIQSKMTEFVRHTGCVRYSFEQPIGDEPKLGPATKFERIRREISCITLDSGVSVPVSSEVVDEEAKRSDFDGRRNEACFLKQLFQMD